jgi:drug/metabolite transporter (DMT)-like permease
MARTREELSLDELFTRLGREMSTLVRQEMQLMAAELRQSVEAIGQSVAFLVAGAAVAYGGVLVILAAVVLALGQTGLPWWLAALIVGAVVAAVGYMLVMRAQSELQAANLALQRTIATLEEDEAWLTEQLR